MINDNVYITSIDNLNDDGSLIDENKIYKLLKIESQVLIATNEIGEASQSVNVLLYCVHPDEKTTPSIAIFTPQNSVSLGIFEDSYDYEDDNEDYYEEGSTEVTQ